MPDISKTVVETLKSQNKKLTTAESCTGGLIAAAITDIAGSSEVFDGGFVTYSNEFKALIINVSRETLREHGAVSQKCATEMAQGALENSNADIAISATGIAGPGGGSAEKPVGLVYIGYATKDGKNDAFENHFNGTRTEVREQTVTKALQQILTILEKDQ